MLNFNERGAEVHWTIKKDLNTSHVKLQQQASFLQAQSRANLNTSHVKLQPKQFVPAFTCWKHLNTSHVKLQQSLSVQFFF